MKTTPHPSTEAEATRNGELCGIDASAVGGASCSPDRPLASGADGTAPHLSQAFESFRHSGFALDELLAACEADGVEVRRQYAR